MRDEMLRAKVLIFMIPLVLPIGQPKATATSQVGEAIVVQPASQTLAIPAEEDAFPLRVDDRE